MYTLRNLFPSLKYPSLLLLLLCSVSVHTCIMLTAPEVHVVLVPNIWVLFPFSCAQVSHMLPFLGWNMSCNPPMVSALDCVDLCSKWYLVHFTKILDFSCLHMTCRQNFIFLSKNIPVSPFVWHLATVILFLKFSFRSLRNIHSLSPTSVVLWIFQELYPSLWSNTCTCLGAKPNTTILVLYKQRRS